MTEEERTKLVARLRAREVVMWTDIDLAADEIERLAEDKKNLALGLVEIADVQRELGAEIERLDKENKELQEHLDWLDSVALGKPS